MRRSVLLCLVCVMGASACYAPAYRQTVHVFGKVDLAADAALAAQAAALPWPVDDNGVRILIGSLPEGLTYSPETGEPVVAPGHEARFQVLGTASSEIPSARGRALIWYAPPHTTAPRYVSRLCAWQAPLRALTLGLWSLVPLNYGCFPSDEADPRIHAGELRRAARAMGGNLVILTGTKSLQVFDRYGSLLAQREGVSMTGYVFVDRGALGRAPQATPGDAS